MTKITKTVDAQGTIRYANERGQPHNENGPAVIFSNGSKCWFNNGIFHNENGPAIVYGDGVCEWFLDNKEYTEHEWKNEMFKRCFQL